MEQQSSGIAPQEIREQAPPGQFITTKFPVLTYGGTPRISLNQWRLRLFGLVEREVELTWDQFTALPRVVITADFHCVTQWSRLNNHWDGVSFSEVAKLANLKPEARFVTARCYGGYTTNLPLDALMDDDVLFADTLDGQPLDQEHGGPLRLVIPKRYGWKSAKWIGGLEFMAQDLPGFWEQRGYNNNADPWKEERFWPDLR